MNKRCAKCGGLIDDGDSVAKVVVGTYKSEDNSVTDAREADCFHGTCYIESIGSPDTVMGRLRALSKKGK